MAGRDRMTIEEVVVPQVLGDEHADVISGRCARSLSNPWRPSSQQALRAGAGVGGPAAYVCGVSTRRVDQLVESLGLRISRSEVSRIGGVARRAGPGVP